VGQAFIIKGNIYCYLPILADYLNPHYQYTQQCWHYLLMAILIHRRLAQKKYLRLIRKYVLHSYHIPQVNALWR